MVPKVRRTQEERTTETRRKLLEATVACLVERGYAGLTTPEVAKKAGLSRGAQLHHFPTKSQLVTAAVVHVFEMRQAELRAALTEMPQGPERVAAAIDLLWRALSAKTSFIPWLELVVAARTDPALARDVEKMSREVRESATQTFRELFPEAPTDVGVHIAFAVLDGLALQSLSAADEEREQMVLNALKRLAELAGPTF